MTPHLGRTETAAAYEQLLQRVYPADTAAAAPPLDREEAAALWQDGRLGNTFETLRHGPARVLDFGAAAPSTDGPPVLRAEIECEGRRLRGDIALHARAEDWETEGCGAAPAYNHVVLHLVFQAPPAAWYTRTAEHRDVPIAVVPPTTLRAVCGCARLYPGQASADLLHGLTAARLGVLLRSAAAYRADRKAAAFEQKAAVLGQEQAWFEAWAEVLGYAANKRSMSLLARRASLAALQGKDAEAVLLGTAGFLQGVLPERTTEEARAYHRRVWGAWWQLRESFSAPPLPWVLSPVRPMNHPTRRVAALALSAQQWPQLLPLMNAAGAKRLTEFLCALSHPFWDTHCTLAAAPLRRRCALVGASRAADFLTNVVYPLDRSTAAWETYLTLRAHDVPTRIAKLADQLFGERPELPTLLRLHHTQQAVLQLADDFADVSLG